MENLKYELEEVLISLGIEKSTKEHEKERIMQEIAEDYRLIKLETVLPEVKKELEFDIKFQIEQLKQLK